MVLGLEIQTDTPKIRKDVLRKFGVQTDGEVTNVQEKEGMARMVYIVNNTPRKFSHD